MARQSTSLTRRERECRKISRSRATRKRLHALGRRVGMAGAALAFTCAVAAGIWEYRSAGISHMIGQGVDAVYAATARAGFSVQAVSLEGRHRTSLAAIKNVIYIKPGAPILAVSLDDMRTNLEKIPTIKHASVERMLPNTIGVKIEERQPVAVWQMNGKLHLIDDEGAVMDDLALQDFQDLPLVVGTGAAQHVKEAVDIIAAAPELASRIVALVRVGDRRWNVRLNEGPEIKLPQEDTIAAWTHFSTLAQSRGLFSEPLLAVDLRLPGRIVLKPAPAAASEHHDGANA